MRRAASLEEIAEVLRAGRGFDRIETPGGVHDLLDHSLQTAQRLAVVCPDDIALQLAGLVHDIGHLLDPRRDEFHAPVAAAYVRPVLGARIAELVRLHVPAKRYLVATEPGYGERLDAASEASLRAQGGAMSRAEITAFEGERRHGEAVVLRRADEAAKVPGAVVPSLEHWRAVMARHCSGRGADPRT